MCPPPFPGSSVQIWRQLLPEMTRVCTTNLSRKPSLPYLSQSPSYNSFSPLESPKHFLEKSLIHTLSCFVKNEQNSPHIYLICGDFISFLCCPLVCIRYAYAYNFSPANLSCVTLMWSLQNIESKKAEKKSFTLNFTVFFFWLHLMACES